jgi:hypothetical protein
VQADRPQLLELGRFLHFWITGGVSLFHGGQRHFPALDFLGLRESLALERGHLIDDGSPAATCAARRWR